MLDWLYPQTVEICRSKFNGEVKVIKSRGRYSVWVGGFEQSGPFFVENLWRGGLEKVTFSPKNILILGLGCGTLVKLIFQKWPAAEITGVEIDPEMIRLGKKYFGLGNFSNLKIKIADATKFLQKNTPKFDLVLADAYIGNKQAVFKKALAGLGKFILVNSLRGTKNYIT